MMRTIIQLRILYAIWVLLGIFSVMYVPSTLVDMTDAAKTVQNIEENTFLFRLGIIGRLLTQLLYIIIPFLLYGMFKKHGKDVAILMLVLALVSVPIAMISESLNIHLIQYLGTPEEVMSRLEFYISIMQISTIFWGLWLLPLGYLVYNSNEFPKLLGLCLYIGGLGYIIGAFNSILYPNFKIVNHVCEILTLGEMVFILWFIFKGRNKTKVQYAVK